MSSFIAAKAYTLANGVNYTPGFAGGPISSNDSWIMNIHVIASLANPVTIVTHAGNSITFPVGSLQLGAIYPYSVKTVTLNAADANKIIGIVPGYKTSIF